MIRKLSVNNWNSKTFNDNIIVELKRPSVILNKEIYQQIESYMDAIQENQEFNSDLRRWKFIMISNEKDRYIKQLENDNKIYQQPFLVRKSENYEIFAMTWDDVFVSFDIVYQNIVDALDIDDEELKKDLKIESVEKSKTSSKKIVNDILN